MSKVIYENSLADEKDFKDFILEGDAWISFEDNAMRIESVEDATLWCTKALPADIRIDWEFRPVKEPGVAMMYFAAKSSDTPCCFVLSYFNRSTEEERSFHTCSLYKNSWENQVSKSADPMAGGGEDANWYRMSIVKRGKDVFYGINNMEILHFHDDGTTLGDILTGGNIGFGQFSDTAALYRNLKVTWI